MKTVQVGPRLVMERSTAVILIALLALGSVLGCGGQDTQEGSNQKADAAQQATQTVEHLLELARVVHVTPAIEADKAVFREGDEVLFVLYRTPEGGWKFHL